MATKVQHMQMKSFPNRWALRKQTRQCYERETEAMEKDKDSFIFFNMDFGALHFKQGTYYWFTPFHESFCKHLSNLHSISCSHLSL